MRRLKDEDSDLFLTPQHLITAIKDVCSLLEVHQEALGITCASRCGKHLSSCVQLEPFGIATAERCLHAEQVPSYTAHPGARCLDKCWSSSAQTALGWTALSMGSLSLETALPLAPSSSRARPSTGASFGALLAVCSKFREGVTEDLSALQIPCHH